MLYRGMTTGTVIGDVVLLPYKDVWQLTFGQKKLLYGKMRLPVRGPGESDDDGSDGADGGGENAEVPPCFPPVAEEADGKGKKKSIHANNNMEPAFYQSLPIEFFEDLYDTFNIKSVVDLTPADGNAALAYLRSTPHKQYVGVCFTHHHSEMLLEHLIDKVLESFGDSTQKALFHPSYVAGAGGNDDAPATKKPQAKQPAEPKPDKEAKEQFKAPYSVKEEIIFVELG